MAKSPVIALLFFGICISSSLNVAHGEAMENKFNVLGHVYCDTCRVEFQTELSTPIEGATVKLQCRNRTNESITYESHETTTDAEGNYEIKVEGDYADSDCEVGLVRSPKADCHDPAEEWRKARVVLTSDDGIRGDFRFANNLGFKKKVALPECVKVLKDMGYYELLEENDEPVPAAVEEEEPTKP